MAHEIGKELWVFWPDNVGAFMYPFYSVLSNFAEVEKFPAIQFRKLTVTEHHRVRGEYDSNDAVPNYDGYVLTDEKGTVWHNQYPYAKLGGQLSNGLGHIFEITEGCEEGKQLLEWMRADEKEARGSSPTPASMALITSELVEMRRDLHTLETGEGIFGMSRDKNPERAAKLRAWIDHILDSFGRQTGLSIIEEPDPIRELRGWYRFSIEEATNEA